MTKKKKTPTKENAAARSLSDRRFHQRIKQSKKKKVDPLQAQKDMREALDEVERCPHRKCHIAKSPNQIMCWAHWWKLEAHMRTGLLSARAVGEMKTFKIRLKEALAYLKEACKPLN